jgi:hypothetical protein
VDEKTKIVLARALRIVALMIPALGVGAEGHWNASRVHDTAAAGYSTLERTVDKLQVTVESQANEIKRLEDINLQLVSVFIKPQALQVVPPPPPLPEPVTRVATRVHNRFPSPPRSPDLPPIPSFSATARGSLVPIQAQLSKIGHTSYAKINLPSTIDDARAAF